MAVSWSGGSRAGGVPLDVVLGLLTSVGATARSGVLFGLDLASAGDGLALSKEVAWLGRAR